MKKTKAAAALLLGAVFTAGLAPPTTVTRAETDRVPPYYYLSGSYDASAEKYTINVYLYSDEVLDVGTFGLKFSDELKDKTKTYTSYLSITLPFEETGVSWDDGVASNISDMLAFSWSASDMYASDGSDIPYKVYIGKLEIEDVTRDELTTKSFTVLDWTSTPMYGGNYINSEIWREGYASEKEQGIKGYYQGQAHTTVDQSIDTWRWVDIGLYIYSDVELADPETLNLTITGKITGYNAKFGFIVYLYEEGKDITSSDPIYTFDSTDAQYRANVTTDDRGLTTWNMVLEDILPDYKYQMVIRKTAHIPYPTITVDPSIAPEDTMTLTVGEVGLICGDLDSNGVIKLRDRVILMRMLNRQNIGSGLGFDMEDLDGIGGVNMMDLAILRDNFETNYDPSIKTEAWAEGSDGESEPSAG